MVDRVEHQPRSEPQGGDNDDTDSDDEEGVNMYHVHDVVEQGAIELLRQLLPPRISSTSNDEDAHPSMQVLATETALLEKDDMGCLPIHVAVIYQRFDCAMHLLHYSDALTSAMVRMKCADLNTPFVHLILRVGGINTSFSTKLIESIFGLSGNSLAERNEDMRALLYDSLNVKDDEGNSVFHLCAMFDLAEAFDTLLKFYASVIEPNSSRANGAVAAIPQVKEILEKGNRLGLRPVHVAMKFGSQSVASRLVGNHGVEVNSLTSLKQTPLHIAATYGFAEGVKLLLNAETPAEKSLLDSFGSSAMDIAIRCGFEQVSSLISGVDGADTTESFPRTRFFFHHDSLRHLPNAYHRRGGPEPPPENPERVDTLVDPAVGILRGREFQQSHISWDYDIEMADIGDILRVHEYHYVHKIRESCKSLTECADMSINSPGQGKEDGRDDDDITEVRKTFVLDSDTALSLHSFEAAARAAGAVCRAVDQVVRGECSNAFCIVRPPGHHAGPTGKVTCCNDPEGSHGFCVFNNVAIGAAYARSHYKHENIHRIAILDFDVHHGNGTEEIVRQLIPSTSELRYSTPYGEGKQIVHRYKPWRNEEDANNVFFSSVHGYGHKDPQGECSTEVQAAWFYPGSGESVEEKAPLVLNVGMDFCHEGSSVSRLKWRSSFRDNILPKLVNFQPDLIFLSAGFDAHKKEHVNWGYVALLEQDYEWLVQHVKQVANTCCNGRLISVLEGGYNFHGRMVSPFARSVAAHVRALACPSRELWDQELIAKEAEHERAILESYRNPATEKKRAAPVEASTVAPFHEEPQLTIAQTRSKRARKQVDYVALAAELERQEDGSKP